MALNFLARRNKDPGAALPSTKGQEWNRESLHQVHGWIQTLGTRLQQYTAELEKTTKKLTEIKAKAFGASSASAKPHQPTTFSGKTGTIASWGTRMKSCASINEAVDACRIACTYLNGEAFSWWKTCRDQAIIRDWPTLRDALIQHFNPLNKAQAARNELHSWREIKDVATFNKSFLSIVLDIPDIPEEQAIDRYSRGLKRDIWELLCAK